MLEKGSFIRERNDSIKSIIEVTDQMKKTI